VKNEKDVIQHHCRYWETTARPMPFNTLKRIIQKYGATNFYILNEIEVAH
jgi:hypothetical protein